MIAAFLLATLIVSFLAGIVALAMPCCFTVLLPAYLAKSFESVGGRIGMTALFGAGIATILIPIAMGLTYFTTFLSVNHPLFFVIGGFFMVILGIVTLSGSSIIPMFSWDVNLKRKDAPSVYTLGVFSGVASSCCAPVLLGVLVLATLSGSLLFSFFVALAYVAGMVFPLLLIALLWEKKARASPTFLQGRMVHLRLFGSELSVHSSKLVAGVLFLAMGAVTILLGVTDRMIAVPGSQFFGVYEGVVDSALLAALGGWIGTAVALALVGALVGAGLLLYRRKRRASREPQESPPRDGVPTPAPLEDGPETSPVEGDRPSEPPTGAGEPGIQSKYDPVPPLLP